MRDKNKNKDNRSEWNENTSQRNDVEGFHAEERKEIQPERNQPAENRSGDDSVNRSRRENEEPYRRMSNEEQVSMENRGRKTNPENPERKARRGSGRGFASMDPDEVREIASMGGRAAHASGKAHEFTSAEARKAARERWR